MVLLGHMTTKQKAEESLRRLSINPVILYLAVLYHNFEKLQTIDFIPILL